MTRTRKFRFAELAWHENGAVHLVCGAEDGGQLCPPVIRVLVGVALLLQQASLLLQRLDHRRCALLQNRQPWRNTIQSTQLRRLFDVKHSTAGRDGWCVVNEHKAMGRKMSRPGKITLERPCFLREHARIIHRRGDRQSILQAHLPHMHAAQPTHHQMTLDPEHPLPYSICSSEVITCRSLTPANICAPDNLPGRGQGLCARGRCRTQW
jgi:hypothetical protein